MFMRILGGLCCAVALAHWFFDVSIWENRKVTGSVSELQQQVRDVVPNPVGPIWICTGLLLIGGAEIRDAIRHLTKKPSPPPSSGKQS